MNFFRLFLTCTFLAFCIADGVLFMFVPYWFRVAHCPWRHVPGGGIFAYLKWKAFRGER